MYASLDNHLLCLYLPRVFSFPLILKTSSNCTLNPYTCTPFVVGAHIYDQCTSWPSKTFSSVDYDPTRRAVKKRDCRAFCVRTSRLRQSFIFRRFINLHFSSLNDLKCPKYGPGRKFLPPP